MNLAYPIIDADGHVLEKDRELHDYLGGRYSSAPRFETYAYFPSLDGWNRGTGVPGKDPETPAPRWLQFLDELGVHTTVLYPTGGLGLGLVQNPEWACVLARAYNSWLADRFINVSPASSKAWRFCRCMNRSKRRKNWSGRNHWAMSPASCRR